VYDAAKGVLVHGGKDPLAGLRDVLPDGVQVHSVRDEDGCSDGTLLAQTPQQQMLSVDVVGPKPVGSEAAYSRIRLVWPLKKISTESASFS
jgi:hypothetical protein